MPEEKKTPEDMIEDIWTYTMGINGQDGFFERTRKRLNRLEILIVIILISLAGAGITIIGL